jgi:hypothetical protein
MFQSLQNSKNNRLKQVRFGGHTSLLEKKTEINCKLSQLLKRKQSSARLPLQQDPPIEINVVKRQKVSMDLKVILIRCDSLCPTLSSSKIKNKSMTEKSLPAIRKCPLTPKRRASLRRPSIYQRRSSQVSLNASELVVDSIDTEHQKIIPQRRSSVYAAAAAKPVSLMPPAQLSVLQRRPSGFVVAAKPVIIMPAAQSPMPPRRFSVHQRRMTVDVRTIESSGFLVPAKPVKMMPAPMPPRRFSVRQR